MTSLDMVREFHERFGQVVNDEPSLGDERLNSLRVDLIAEELCELAEALGCKIEFTWEAYDLPTKTIAALDALTDLQYVLDGAYLSLGFAHLKDAALAEVHRSNMSKLGADGRPVLRDDGKILKGPGYSPPDLATVLSQGGETVNTPEFNPARNNGRTAGDAYMPSVSVALAGSSPAPDTVAELRRSTGFLDANGEAVEGLGFDNSGGGEW